MNWHRGLAFTLVVVYLGWGCGGASSNPLPYERCLPGDTCEFNAACLASRLTTARATSGAVHANFCTTTCAMDSECQGLDAVCVGGAGGAGDGGVGDGGGGDAGGLCHRRCTFPCRAGTACVRGAARGLDVCVPIGPEALPGTAYQPCHTTGVVCRDGTSCDLVVLAGSGAATAGMCTVTGCATAAQCPGYVPGLVECVTLAGVPPQCAPTCHADTDCVPYGTTCVVVDVSRDVRVCLPAQACAADGGCAGVDAGCATARDGGLDGGCPP